MAYERILMIIRNVLYNPEQDSWLTYNHLGKIQINSSQHHLKINPDLWLTTDSKNTAIFNSQLNKIFKTAQNWFIIFKTLWIYSLQEAAHDSVWLNFFPRNNDARSEMQSPVLLVYIKHYNKHKKWNQFHDLKWKPRNANYLGKPKSWKELRCCANRLCNS